MQITESNMTLAPQWAHLQAAQSSLSARVHPRPAPETAAGAATLLDTDRDGWLDEDDVPYDQLQRLERKAEAYAELGAIRLPSVTRPAAAAALDPRPAAVERQQQGGAGAATQIDLLA